MRTQNIVSVSTDSQDVLVHVCIVVYLSVPRMQNLWRKAVRVSHGSDVELDSSTGDTVPMINVSPAPNAPLIHQATDPGKGLGLPTSKNRVSAIDTITTLICLLCFAATLLTISERVATRLGQTNQLIVIGFLLAIEGSCTARHVQLFLLFWEGHSKKAALQNFDGILRKSPLARQLNWIYRTALLFLFALPLALSIGYKRFIGGSSSVPSPNTRLVYGTTGPPGT